MNFWNIPKPKPKPPSLYTKFEPVNYKRGLELIVAYPLTYGVMWSCGAGEYDQGCNARFFSQSEAQAFCDYMIAKATNGWHYEVVRLMDDK